MEPHRKHAVIAALAGAVVVAGLLARADASDPLTPQERRGKQIYLRGASPGGGDIIAYLAEGSVEIPASTMPCANCHGLDGRGIPEGGVIPSDITWTTLTKPYGLTHQDGRKHPPYGDKALELAIIKGVDPGGNKLQQAMPRYWMSRDDLNDLVAYMKRLGNETDPGLADTSLKLGTVIPAAGPLTDTGAVMKAALAAYFEELNTQGGVYNRRIELVSGESNALLGQEQVFALVGGIIAGNEKQVASLALETETPVVGPSTLYPETGSPPNRYLFYTFSGIKEQASALLAFATQKLGGDAAQVAVVCDDRADLADVARTVVEKVDDPGKPKTVIDYRADQFDASRLAGQLSRAELKAILFIGQGREANLLMREIAALRSAAPLLLIPGPLAAGEALTIPPSFKGKVLLSFPTIPSDMQQPALYEYQQLARKHRLPARHVAAQLSALCAAKVMVEALKLAGREVTREKLVIALEGLYELQTGLAPPISYGPNRRVGALGAYVVSIDPDKGEFTPVGGWVRPD